MCVLCVAPSVWYQPLLGWREDQTLMVSSYGTCEDVGSWVLLDGMCSDSIEAYERGKYRVNGAFLIFAPLAPVQSLTPGIVFDRYLEVCYRAAFSQR